MTSNNLFSDTLTGPAGSWGPQETRPELVEAGEAVAHLEYLEQSGHGLGLVRLQGLGAEVQHCWVYSLYYLGVVSQIN